jgi:hypothetical protein
MPEVFYICWQTLDSNGDLCGDVHYSPPIDHKPGPRFLPNADNRFLAKVEVASLNKKHQFIHHWVTDDPPVNAK